MLKTHLILIIDPTAERMTWLLSLIIYPLCSMQLQGLFVSCNIFLQVLDPGGILSLVVPDLITGPILCWLLLLLSSILMSTVALGSDWGASAFWVKMYACSMFGYIVSTPVGGGVMTILHHFIFDDARVGGDSFIWVSFLRHSVSWNLWIWVYLPKPPHYDTLLLYQTVFSPLFQVTFSSVFSLSNLLTTSFIVVTRSLWIQLLYAFNCFIFI